MFKRKPLYVGAAGQAAVMSELLMLGYNVAVPEVDVGDDLFVVNDNNGNYRRVQVKTAIAQASRSSYAAQFSIPLRQIERPYTPELCFVFAVRHADRWSDFIIIEREELFEEHRTHGVGNLFGRGGELMVKLYLSFRGSDVICSGRSFQKMRNQFAMFQV